MGFGDAELYNMVISYFVHTIDSFDFTQSYLISLNKAKSRVSLHVANDMFWLYFVQGEDLT